MRNSRSENSFGEVDFHARARGRALSEIERRDRRSAACGDSPPARGAGAHAHARRASSNSNGLPNNRRRPVETRHLVGRPRQWRVTSGAACASGRRKLRHTSTPSRSGSMRSSTESRRTHRPPPSLRPRIPCERVDDVAMLTSPSGSQRPSADCLRSQGCACIQVYGTWRLLTDSHSRSRRAPP